MRALQCHVKAAAQRGAQNETADWNGVRAIIDNIAHASD
jgi:hypothetical protein